MEIELKELFFDLQKLDFKDEGLTWANVSTCSGITISEIGWDEELVLGTDGHELQTFGPAFDDFLHAKGDRLTALHRAVEDFTADECAMVVDVHFVGWDWLRAFSCLDDLDRKSVV